MPFLDTLSMHLLDWIGVGAEHYIHALKCLKDDEVISNANKDGDHPTMAYRVQFLEYMLNNRPLR